MPYWFENLIVKMLSKEHRSLFTAGGAEVSDLTRKSGELLRFPKNRSIRNKSARRAGKQLD